MIKLDKYSFIKYDSFIIFKVGKPNLEPANSLTTA